MQSANSSGCTSRTRPARGGPRFALACLLTILGAVAQGSDYPLTIMEPRVRLPEELVSSLQPLAGPDGAVVAANHLLFVRASPARLDDIRRALATLDRPLRNLLIQVRQQADTRVSGRAAGVRVDEPVGDARIRIGRPGPGGSGVTAWAGERTGRRDLTQEVRTLDGRQAFIAVGTDEPLPYREVTRGPGGLVVHEGNAYHHAESGFFVRPRVQGERVTLELSAQAQGSRGTLTGSAVAAQFEGRLGDWIPVALSHQEGTTNSSGLLRYGTASGSSEARVELRVLPLD